MKLDIVSVKGAKTGRQVDLPDEIFGIEPNEHAVYLAVKQYLAHQRQGTHKAKERGEIKGSTKKIKKQKGTGTARFGDIKNPVFRGGGRMFGPRPRNYNIKLNKKVKRLARNSVLSSKMTDGKVMVVENQSFDAPKTKSFVDIVNGLEVNGQKALFVIGDHDQNLYLSSRNVPKANVMRVQDLNAYQLMNANTILFFENSVDKMKEVFA